MSPSANETPAIDVARALRERFEADAMLGARALPIVIPKRPDPPPVLSKPTALPVVRRQALDDEEVRRRQEELDSIDNGEVSVCTKCALFSTRTKTVFGVGSPAARIMFIGEAPGHDEDVSGVPFVGRAGALLTKMIEGGMGLKREDVYICNILKCRPPNNRDPAADETLACKDYLWRQIEIIRPEAIIALGAPAARTLLNTRDGIGRLRSQWHDFYTSGAAGIGDPIPVMPTYHPAYLLRSPGEKAKSWADLQMVMARLGLPLPKRR
jgi:uracil-DNA glycosylase family 4